MTLTISMPSRVVDDAGFAEIALLVDGERLWFRLAQDGSPPLRGEPVVAALLVAAMRRGTDLVLPAELPVSGAFLAGCHAAMGVMRHWGSHFGCELTPIRIVATEAAPHAGRHVGVALADALDTRFALTTSQIRYDRGLHVVTSNPSAAVEATLPAEQWLPPRVAVTTNVEAVATRLGTPTRLLHIARWVSTAYLQNLTQLDVPIHHPWLDPRPSAGLPVVLTTMGGPGLTIRAVGFGAMRWEKLRAVQGQSNGVSALPSCTVSAAARCGTCRACRRASFFATHLELLRRGEAPMRPGTVPTIQDHDDWVFALEGVLLARHIGDRMLEKRLASSIRRFQWSEWFREARTYLGLSRDAAVATR